MNDFVISLFISILNMSFSATIAALSIIIARILLKKSPKVFSYTLWVVVLFHLVCPFTFEGIIGLLPPNIEPILQDIINTQTLTMQSGVLIIDTPVNNALTAILPAATAANSSNPIFDILVIISTIWLCGAAVLLLYTLVTYVWLQRCVYDATLLNDNVYETDKISTAFVLGFISPKICTVKYRFCSTQFDPTTRECSYKETRLSCETNRIRRARPALV